MSSLHAAAHPFLLAPRAGETLTTCDGATCHADRASARRASGPARGHDATSYVAELRRTLEAIGWR